MAGYIGSKASVVSSGAERKKTFAITTSTTSLTGLVYTPTKVHVFHNGVRLVDGTDFTATNSTSITLTVAAENGDQVVVVSYATFQTSDTVSASAGGTFGGNIDVTGTVTADGLTVDGATRINDSEFFIADNNTSDTAKLSMDVDTTNGARIRTTVNGTAAIQPLGIYTGSTLRQKFNTNGDISFYEDTGAQAKFFWDASAEALGIGTSSPERTLHVNSGSTNGIAVFESTDSIGVVYLADSNSSNKAQVGIGAVADDMIFNAGGATAMRINSSGNVLVGTTSAPNGTSSYGSGFITTSVDRMLLRLASSSTGGGVTLVAFDNPNGQVGGITTSGSSTSYNTSSDYRLKTDAQPMTGASARVQALNPVNFEWIASGDRVDGFLAHEAQAVVPESVTGTKDAMMDEEYEVTAAVYEDVVIEAVLDDEGNELEAERTEQNLVTEAVMGTRNVPDYQGIDQSKLVPLLTAALQEALTKIDDMETRLAALEGN